MIIGGQVADAGADLLTPLQEEVWARSRGLLGREVPIVEQQVADKSGIVGAAGLSWRRGTDHGVAKEIRDHCFPDRVRCSVEVQLRCDLFLTSGPPLARAGAPRLRAARA